jgi:hypothetical protein
VPDAADSEGLDCCELSAGYGLTPFDWQRNALVDSMGIRLDGRWAASRVGWSVPRQNGKNGGVEMFELHVMAILGMRVLHSAHEVKTARKAFKRLLDFFDNPRKYPELAALVKEIRRTNGQEAIELHNGGLVEFVARTKSSGRGFSADILVMDEAQELTDDELEAMLPTISASQNPLLFLLGTPPKPEKAAVVWRRFRQAAVDGTDPLLCWIEYGVAPDADFASRDSAAAANPGAPESISWDTIAGEFAAMSLEGFAAERLGVWFPQAAGSEILDPAVWLMLTAGSKTPASPVLSLEVALDRSRTTIGAAWKVQGKPHVEIVEDVAGTDVVPRVVELQAKYGVSAVVVDGGTEAASLIQALEAARVKVLKVGAAERAAACAGFYDLAMTQGLSHNGDPAIANALSAARWKDVGEGARVFSRRRSAADIAALYAVVLALHGLDQGPKREFWGAFG